MGAKKIIAICFVDLICFPYGFPFGFDFVAIVAHCPPPKSLVTILNSEIVPNYFNTKKANLQV